MNNLGQRKFRKTWQVGRPLFGNVVAIKVLVSDTEHVLVCPTEYYQDTVNSITRNIDITSASIDLCTEEASDIVNRLDEYHVDFLDNLVYLCLLGAKISNRPLVPTPIYVAPESYTINVDNVPISYHFMD